MNQEKIGYTRCEDCGGTGTKPDEMPCTTCEGTGLVVVCKEPLVLGMRPVESSKRRRQFPRHYTDLPIQLRNQQGQDFAGRCIVIAEGGFGAVLPDPIPAGSMVTVQVSIPTHATALKAQAIVHSQKGLRHGFGFVSLGDSERVALRRFCDGLMIQSDDERRVDS
jgi:PilZ domain